MIYHYGAYNITVTKDGYQTYTTLLNMTKKEDLTIALQQNTSTGFSKVVWLGMGLAFATLIGFGLLATRKREEQPF